MASDPLTNGARGERGQRGRTGATGATGDDAGHARTGSVYNRIREHSWIVVTVLCFAAIGYSHMVSQRADTNIKKNQTTGRMELCKAIDGDHNRERARILAGQKLIYRVASFRVLVNTPEAERAAYDKAKHDYGEVRKTRPPFCRAYPNPVKKFPPISEFRKGGNVLPAGR
jgi:hypothetical protein